MNNYKLSILVDFRTLVEHFEDMIITFDSKNEDDCSDKEIEI